MAVDESIGRIERKIILKNLFRCKLFIRLFEMAQNELVHRCSGLGSGINAMVALGGGFLSGKYRKDKPIAEDQKGPMNNKTIPIDLDKGYAVMLRKKLPTTTKPAFRRQR